MPGGTPRVIFDCNIFFQAFLTPEGPAYACLRVVDGKRAKLLLSLDLLAEARNVLNRPFVRERFPHVTPEGIDRFLSAVTYTAELWRSVQRIQKYDRDPDDEPYLNLAIVAQADYVVTRDNDMLALATDHSPPSQAIPPAYSQPAEGRNAGRVSGRDERKGILHREPDMIGTRERSE
jgi:putative PIN family toxin of toxin-antitoxin system